MNILKVIILALMIFVAPVPALGVFGVPQEHINSMDYGIKPSARDDNETVVIPSAEQINASYNSNKQNVAADSAASNDALSHNEETAQSQTAQGPVSLPANPWIIFLAAIALVIIIFVLLKFKKVI